MAYYISMYTYIINYSPLSFITSDCFNIDTRLLLIFEMCHNIEINRSKFYYVMKLPYTKFVEQNIFLLK